MSDFDEMEGPANYPPPPELSAYLGQLLMAFGYAETALHYLVWRILGVTLDDGRALTGRLDVRPRISLLEGLCERHIATDHRKRQLLAATKALTYASEYRNMAAHGDWRRTESGHLCCFSLQYAPPDSPYGVKRCDLSELSGATTDCQKATLNLWDVDAWLKVTPRASW